MTMLRLGSILLLLATSLLGQPARPLFQVRTQTQDCPEMGKLTISLWHCQGQEFSFLSPAGWRLATDPTQGRLVFQSHDFSATITARFQRVGPTNPAPVRLASLRQEVMERFPGATLLEEVPCHTGNLQGRSFALRQRVQGGVVQWFRLAIVPLPAGRLEFTLAAPPQRAEALQAEFTTFLTSFSQVQAGGPTCSHAPSEPGWAHRHDPASGE
jgi:hypothetical protein